MPSSLSDRKHACDARLISSCVISINRQCFAVMRRSPLIGMLQVMPQSHRVWRVYTRLSKCQFAYICTYVCILKYECRAGQSTHPFPSSACIDESRLAVALSNRRSLFVRANFNENVELSIRRLASRLRVHSFRSRILPNNSILLAPARCYGTLQRSIAWPIEMRPK